MEQNLLIVEDLETLQFVKDYISNPEFEYVAYDTETTGVGKEAEIIGFSLAAEESIGIYVVLSYWESTVKHDECKQCPAPMFKKDGTLKKAAKCKVCKNEKVITTHSGKMHYLPEMKAAAKEIIETLKTKKLIMHNAPFDCEMTNRDFKIELMPSVHTDTLPLARLLNENESGALKEIGYRLFGESAKKEQAEMKASVIQNGGTWSEGPKGVKEMYKADKDLLGMYAAKDAILTLKIFYELIPQLFEEGLDKFFYEDESMPLLRGPTYEMNTTGLRVDTDRLTKLRSELDDECQRLKSEIFEAIYDKVKDKYPDKTGPKAFNIGASQQMAWLMFIRLGNEFSKLTDGGRDLAKRLLEKVPYNAAAKRAFIKAIHDERHRLEEEMLTETNETSLKIMRKQANKMWPEKYLKCDKDTLVDFAKKYDWVVKLLKYSNYKKLRSTYCDNILSKQRYAIIHPSFHQSGTTSGRYSSSDPNFQNLPRDDKRIKSCIISRPGKVFVGADYSQLEPRCFASTSQDPALMSCFEKGQDFYSVVGIPIFKDFSYSAYKKDPNSWAVKQEHKRQIAKAFALATPYGTTSFQQAEKLRDQEGNRLTHQECQAIIDAYVEAYPLVHKMMVDSHQMVMRDGAVYNLFGRPRRIPEAKRLLKIYGPNACHEDMPYEHRSLLNLSMNHRVQSTAASIVNRAAIAFYKRMRELNIDASLILQVHDELVAECWEKDKEIVARELKHAMENTNTLPGVKLVAEPKIAKNLADLK